MTSRRRRQRQERIEAKACDEFVNPSDAYPLPAMSDESDKAGVGIAAGLHGWLRCQECELPDTGRRTIAGECEEL